jgi:hypothetical protein
MMQLYTLHLQGHTCDDRKFLYSQGNALTENRLSVWSAKILPFLKRTDIGNQLLQMVLKILSQGLTLPQWSLN